jgi:hypothetical protein
VRLSGSAALCGIAAVCGRARGSVWQCSSVRRGAAVCGRVQQCAAGPQCAAIRQCAAVRAAVCGSVRDGVRLLLFYNYLFMFKHVRLNLSWVRSEWNVWILFFIKCLYCLSFNDYFLLRSKFNLILNQLKLILKYTLCQWQLMWN